MMKILLAEDSGVQAKVIANQLHRQLNAWIVICYDYEDVQCAIKECNSEFTIALVNIVMPGAENGEAISMCLNAGIPTVVITSSFNSARRKEILAWKVLDYVVKDGPASIDFLVELVNRMVNNHAVKVLVAEDSSVTRTMIANMLREFQLQVFEARDGAEALQFLKENPDISLLVTDYEMPNMNGAQLIRAARTFANKDTLSIIGLSASNDETLSARLLKAGANDFIHKPFYREEFYCRVSQNITLVEHMTALTNAATRDYLTGLYNRRHFFDIADELFARRDKGEISIAVGMLDIDHFKAVNDTYGHDAGDQALKMVADVLDDQLGESDALARVGGEEFCVVVVDADSESVEDVFEGFRQRVEAIRFDFEGQNIPLRLSIGVSDAPDLDIHGLLMEADKMLYHAKENGRNQVQVANYLPV